MILAWAWAFNPFTTEARFYVLNAMVNPITAKRDHSLFNLFDYTQSHIKSDQPGSHDFCGFLSQFSTDFHEILQSLFFEKIPTVLKIS